MKKLKTVLLILTVIFCISACEKETFTENEPPVVNAGNDTTFKLATPENDTVLLSGSATDSDGQVMGYTWSQISGPNAAKILYPGSATTKVSDVIAGQYIFQLMATDDKGATGVKTVKIVVEAPPQIYTLPLQPRNNPNESSVYSYYPDGTGVGTPQVVIGAWTQGGAVYNRTYLKFDFSIPSGAIINNAKLSLYATPDPKAGNFVDAHYGSANSFYIQRITSSWTGAGISWNKQPTTTNTNQVIVPNSTSSFENNIDIDVTQLVKDMQLNGNNGFAMRLLAENYYNIRQYVSSYHTDATKHPKLVIQYSK
jgi:hypothetical protein